MGLKCYTFSFPGSKRNTIKETLDTTEVSILMLEFLLVTIVLCCLLALTTCIIYIYMNRFVQRPTKHKPVVTTTSPDGLEVSESSTANDMKENSGVFTKTYGENSDSETAESGTLVGGNLERDETDENLKSQRTRDDPTNCVQSLESEPFLKEGIIMMKLESACTSSSLSLAA